MWILKGAGIKKAGAWPAFDDWYLLAITAQR